MKEIYDTHRLIAPEIQKKKEIFTSNLYRNEAFYAEAIFCLCTPQSHAHAAWDATKEIINRRLYSSPDKMAALLGDYGVRFKNNKARNIHTVMLNMNSLMTFIYSHRADPGKYLRNTVADMVHGYGLKEASHFLRNIGLGQEICILDRHILRCLQRYDVIDEIPKTLTQKKYFEIEDRMLAFASSLKIPPEELDFVFWYIQNKEIFK